MGIIGDCDELILNTYKRYPLVFIRGIGVYLYTDDGNRYLDMGSGIAVTSLGHSHPRLSTAIENQAKKLIHTSNLYYTFPQTELAYKLVRASVFNKVFFCNSGAEANEAAIKLSRKHGKASGNKDKFEIITMKNSFHGRTMATVTATGQTKYQKGFEPLLPGIKYAEFNNEKSLTELVNENTSAVFIEPVQGEGGIHLADKNFIKTARKLCDKYNALLIFDEVQTGVGRTGKLYCYEHFLPIEPDVITTAKGLAGGLPIGAMLLKEKFANLLGPGEHASTFGGNLLSCVAASTVLDVIAEQKLLENADKMGNLLRKRLHDLKWKHKSITKIRGIGLLNGIEINFKATDLVNKLIENFILTIPAGDNVVRIMPPLIINQDNIEEFIFGLEKSLSDFK
jgi:acetylornithine/N-succinyldiaminopimelate aminotransferase